jgi:hypothetical protein
MEKGAKFEEDGCVSIAISQDTAIKRTSKNPLK